MDGGLNPYTYAANNPLGLIDKTGTQPAGLQQDAEGNYILPEEVITIIDKKPLVDELDIQKRGGASHYDSRAEVERQLRFQMPNQHERLQLAEAASGAGLGCGGPSGTGRRGARRGRGEVGRARDQGIPETARRKGR